MLYYEFAPLKENYKTLVLSTTELESVLSPSPYKITDDKKRIVTLEIGHLAEQIARAVVSNDSNDMAYLMIDAVRSYLRKERMQFFNSKGDEDKQFLWFYDGMEQLIDLYTPYKNIYDLRNFRALCEIDFSGFKILLSGELDWGINNLHLYDNKTAKTKWKEEEKRETSCYQARFYSWFNMLANGNTCDNCSLDFTYLVQTKQKKMQLQEITHSLTYKQCLDFVYDKLYQYCLKVHNGEVKLESTVEDRI